MTVASFETAVWRVRENLSKSRRVLVSSLSLLGILVGIVVCATGLAVSMARIYLPAVADGRSATCTVSQCRGVPAAGGVVVWTASLSLNLLATNGVPTTPFDAVVITYARNITTLEPLNCTQPTLQCYYDQNDVAATLSVVDSQAGNRRIGLILIECFVVGGALAFILFGVWVGVLCETGAERMFATATSPEAAVMP